MKLEIEKKQKNPLMNREEVEVLLEHSRGPTPQRAEILETVAKTLGANKELIIVDKIFNVKGKASSTAKIFIYQNKKDIPPERLEKMKRRMEKKMKKPTEEKPKEAAKPEEAKPEEKEKTTEEKKAEGSKSEENPEEAPKEESKSAEAPKEAEKKPTEEAKGEEEAQTEGEKKERKPEEKTKE